MHGSMEGQHVWTINRFTDSRVINYMHTLLLFKICKLHIYQTLLKLLDTCWQTSRDPASYLLDNPIQIPFEFDTIHPIHILDIIKSLTSKSCTDIDGISSALLKHIGHEICIPLAHIFNRSLITGIFPEALKASRIVPTVYINQALQPPASIIGQ
jgi:hypothetical protein